MVVDKEKLDESSWVPGGPEISNTEIIGAPERSPIRRNVLHVDLISWREDVLERRTRGSFHSSSRAVEKIEVRSSAGS
jgi:hypothetical protein